MNPVKKKLAQALGDYVDEAKVSYRLMLRRMKEEGVGLFFSKLEIKEGSNGKYKVFWDGNLLKEENPRLYEFIARGVFLKKDSDLKADNAWIMSSARNEVYRPWMFNDENYELIFQSGEQEFRKEISNIAAITSTSSGVGDGLRFDILPEELVNKINETGCLIIKIKITKLGPIREELNKIFNAHSYIPLLLDPKRLFRKSDRGNKMKKKTKIKRLQLYGVDLPEDVSNEVLESTINDLRWSNFGLKDVLALEKVVEAFGEDIDNDKLFTEFPTPYVEAGVMVRWNQIIQSLLSKNEPIPVPR